MDKRPERLAIFPAGGVREKKTANFRQTLAGIKKMTYICIRNGGLAQLARALAWHARGHEFESRILHSNARNLLKFSKLRAFFKNKRDRNGTVHFHRFPASIV